MEILVAEVIEAALAAVSIVPLGHVLSVPVTAVREDITQSPISQHISVRNVDV
jgi:hypothetical protein